MMWYKLNFFKQYKTFLYKKVLNFDGVWRWCTILVTTFYILIWGHSLQKGLCSSVNSGRAVMWKIVEL